MDERNEVELYRTVDMEAKDRLISRLVKARVSYLEKWEKVSLFRRKEYGGAREICVIYINENQKDQAFSVLDEFTGKGHEE